MLDFVKRSGTMLIVSGVIGIIFGLMAIFWPVSTIFALVMLWGFYAFADGIIAIITAFQPAGKKVRWWLVALGVLGIIAGIIVVFRPISSAIAFSWVLGLWLILRGIIGLISAFGPVTKGSRWMIGLSGVMFIVAGVLFILNPGGAALGFAALLGILALAWGVFQLIGGIRIRREAQQDHV